MRPKRMAQIMRKRIHRLFQPNTAMVMTIFFLLFGVIFTQRAYADGDVTAPEIRRISFTPSTVENDGVITYTMDISFNDDFTELPRPINTPKRRLRPWME